MEGTITHPDEVDAPRKRSRLTTLCYAGPLLACGMTWLGVGLWHAPNTGGAWVLGLIGVFYLVSGHLLFTSWKGAPKLAMVAWAPFFLGIPIGTVLALIAFRGLKKWNAASASAFSPAESTASRPRSVDLQAVVHAFVTEFGAYENASGAPLSISRDLLIPRGTFARFLDDLRIDRGFATSGKDADEVDTLHELLELLSTRHSAEGVVN
jgi:hypothetical protein